MKVFLSLFFSLLIVAFSIAQTEPPITSIKIVEKPDRHEVIIGGYAGEDFAFRKISGSALERSIWIEIPKPQVYRNRKHIGEKNKDSYNFESGVYEFINVYNYPGLNYPNGEEVRISQPFRYVYLREIQNNGSATFKIGGEVKSVISPQPTNDFLNINLNSSDQIKEIEIFDLNGQLKKKIIPKAFDNVKLNVSDLVSGLYLLKIHTPTETQTSKILIK